MSDQPNRPKERRPYRYGVRVSHRETRLRVEEAKRLLLLPTPPGFTRATYRREVIRLTQAACDCIYVTALRYVQKAEAAIDEKPNPAI